MTRPTAAGLISLGMIWPVVGLRSGMPFEFVGIQYGPLTPTKASTFEAPMVMTLTLAWVSDSPGIELFSPSFVSVEVSTRPDVSGTRSCPLFWKARLI